MLFGRLKNPNARLIDAIGLKKGDRTVHVGCPEPSRLVAISNHVGGGNVLVLVSDQESADRARAAAASADIPLDVKMVSLTNLRGPSPVFDVVLVDDTQDLIESIRPERRRSALGELQRVLRPGGRIVIISRQPRGGTIGALLAGVSRPLVDELKRWLEAEDFTSVRRLSTPGELVLTEGVKRPGASSDSVAAGDNTS
jgi:ubiquinone/menaquinone biosynthesis C-methylase UbiE